LGEGDTERRKASRKGTGTKSQISNKPEVWVQCPLWHQTLPLNGFNVFASKKVFIKKELKKSIHIST